MIQRSFKRGSVGAWSVTGYEKWGADMKVVNWDNDGIRNRVDHDTPFMEIALPGRRMIRLWWTPVRAYGPQVLALIYGDDTPLYWVSGGCGYNKTHAALETCFDELGKEPRGFSSSQDLYRYHVGGNFYRVPVRDWLKRS